MSQIPSVSFGLILRLLGLLLGLRVTWIKVFYVLLGLVLGFPDIWDLLEIITGFRSCEIFDLKLFIVAYEVCRLLLGLLGLSVF